MYIGDSKLGTNDLVFKVQFTTNKTLDLKISAETKDEDLKMRDTFVIDIEAGKVPSLM